MEAVDHPSLPGWPGPALPPLVPPDAPVRRTLIDAGRESELTAVGYTVVPLLTAADVARVREVCTAVGPAPGDPRSGFFQGYESTSLEWKRCLADQLRPIVVPRLDALFDRHHAYYLTVLVKWPGPDGALPVHQDPTMVDEEGRFRSVAVWCPLEPLLDEEGRDLGTLHVLPGSHLMPPSRWVRARGYARPTFDGLQDHARRASVAVRPAPGEAVVFEHRTAHHSPPNLSDRPRWVLAVALRPVEATNVDVQCRADGTVEVRAVGDDYYLADDVSLADGCPELRRGRRQVAPRLVPADLAAPHGHPGTAVPRPGRSPGPALRAAARVARAGWNRTTPTGVLRDAALDRRLARDGFAVVCGGGSLELGDVLAPGAVAATRGWEVWQTPGPGSVDLRVVRGSHLVGPGPPRGLDDVASRVVVVPVASRDLVVVDAALWRRWDTETPDGATPALVCSGGRAPRLSPGAGCAGLLDLAPLPLRDHVEGWWRLVGRPGLEQVGARAAERGASVRHLRPGDARRAGAWLGRRVTDANEAAIRRATRHEPALRPVEGLRWVAELEAEWPAIRAEAEAALRDGAAPLTSDLSGTDQANEGRWQIYVLRHQGRDVPEHVARCPRTARAVAAVPGAIGAAFSVLGPGASLPPHRGPNPAVLRHHLALIVPGAPGESALTVEGVEVPWVEGRSILFDDMAEHSARNGACSDRVVLALDIAKPLPRLVRPLASTSTRMLRRGPYGDGMLERLGVRSRSGWLRLRR